MDLLQEVEVDPKDQDEEEGNREENSKEHLRRVHPEVRRRRCEGEDRSFFDEQSGAGIVSAVP